MDHYSRKPTFEKKKVSLQALRGIEGGGGGRERSGNVAEGRRRQEVVQARGTTPKLANTPLGTYKQLCRGV